MRKLRYLIPALTLVFLGTVGVGGAIADTIPIGPVNLHGTGFGHVNTLLTMQGTGRGMGMMESGCAGVNGSGATALGHAYCRGSNVGGQEKGPASFPHNSTPVITNAANLVIIFNPDQPGKGPITLYDLILTFYNGTGGVGFSSSDFTSPIFFSSTDAGIGKSGFGFKLDASQAAMAQTAIGLGFDRLGLSATAGPAFGGPETFFSAEQVTSETPEPASFLLFGTALAGLVAKMRRRAA